jgi:hypothetical protein
MENHDKYKGKISRHNLIITRAVKERTVVIMGQAQYDDKIIEFIHSNGITAQRKRPHNLSIGN